VRRQSARQEADSPRQRGAPSPRSRKVRHGPIPGEVPRRDRDNEQTPLSHGIGKHQLHPPASVGLARQHEVGHPRRSQRALERSRHRGGGGEVAGFVVQVRSGHGCALGQAVPARGVLRNGPAGVTLAQRGNQRGGEPQERKRSRVQALAAPVVPAHLYRVARVLAPLTRQAEEQVVADTCNQASPGEERGASLLEPKQSPQPMRGAGTVGARPPETRRTACRDRRQQLVSPGVVPLDEPSPRPARAWINHHERAPLRGHPQPGHLAPPPPQGVPQALQDGREGAVEFPRRLFVPSGPGRQHGAPPPSRRSCPRQSR